MQKAYNGTERRKNERMKLVTFCTSHFKCGGREHTALMMDVSTRGAGFRSDAVSDDLRLNRGDVLDVTIRTPYGPSDCKGRIVWFKKGEEYCTWGMEFTELSDDEKDPLRCLMDSSF